MTTSQRIQSEIVDLEARLAPINAQLDALYERFAADLVPDVAKWMNGSVRRRIEENAAKVNAGGVEPLRQVKVDLTILIEQLPEICQKAIGTPEQWPHRVISGSRTDASSNTSTGESYPAACFRRAINPLGSLLAKHGLLVEKPGYSAEWESAGANGYRYKINPGFDARNFPALQEYQAKRTESSKLNDAIAEKLKELEKAKARELWDAA